MTNQIQAIELHSVHVIEDENSAEYPGFIYLDEHYVHAVEGDAIKINMQLMKPSLEPYFTPFMTITFREWETKEGCTRLRIYASKV